MTNKNEKMPNKAEYGDNNATFQSPGMAYFKMSHFVPKWVLEDAQIKYYGGERTVRNWVFIKKWYFIVILSLKMSEKYGISVISSLKLIENIRFDEKATSFCGNFCMKSI